MLRMLHSADDPAPWQRLDTHVTRALTARLDLVADDLARRVVTSVPGFAGIDDPRFLRNAHETARVAVERFAELAGTTEQALTPSVREVYQSLGAAEAREDRGLEVLTTALRTSARLLMREVTAALAQAGQVTPERVLDVADATSAFVDELIAACTDGFALQVRELAGERDRRRHRLVELLLAGNASGAEVSAAAAAIGWPQVGMLVPVVLPSAEAREARFRFGSDALVTERADSVLALVRMSQRYERDLLGPVLARRGAVVGPAVGWADLPGAVRVTDLTARQARPDGRATQATQATQVIDHLVPLALLGEPMALAMLVRLRLAAFATLPESQRRPLLITLESWLRHWGARNPVADELFIHPQTVSYRIRRARELAGGDLDDPDLRFQLQLALTTVLGRGEES
jgi:PucR C-terminal helix-turn-helix domain